ncbi:MAG: hypothetical protein DMG23_14975, partial [Acidobacteria bacterium]
DWEQEAIRKIAGGIAETAKRVEPVRLGAGWGQVDIGHDRRFVQADGSVRMLWRNATRAVTYPVDTTVGVLRVDIERGEPLAILVNYACHPVVFTADNDLYSADYPGAMRRYVEKNFGGSVTCFFLQGAAGNINPYFDKTYLEEDSPEMMRLTGERLGKEVVRVARQIQPTGVPNGEIAFLTDTQRFNLRLHWRPFRESCSSSSSRTCARDLRCMTRSSSAIRTATLAIYRRFAQQPQEAMAPPISQSSLNLARVSGWWIGP